jgi:tRNA(Ile)-lysidine synthase
LSDLVGEFTAAMTAIAAPFPDRIGVAVSGGGDSVALLALMADWARAQSIALHVATVNHGLRPEAVAEADTVATLAKAFGVSHDILDWTDWDHRGNLQDAAREARISLMSAWAKARAIPAIALGHTRDDQAETVLMRLARGSGVDGLAGMSARSTRADIVWLRPLLNVSRADLRSQLRARGLTWAEDPSNDDPKFDRVKARQALQALAPLGITSERLVQTAARMAAARDVLAQTAVSEARKIVTLHQGDVLIDHAGLFALPLELRDRIFAQALCFVSGASYRPRRDGLQRMLNGDWPATLHGTHVSLRAGRLRIAREWSAVRDVSVSLGQVWDGRWQVSAPPDFVQTAQHRYVVRALGESALALCPERKNSALPATSLISSPSIWCEGRLIAAPVAQFGLDWAAKPLQTAVDFCDRLLSH